IRAPFGGEAVVRFRLIPREEKFYDDFKAMADQLRVGARLLEEMFASDPPIADKAAEIKEAEHKCDVLTHDIIQRLNKTFVKAIGELFDQERDAIAVMKWKEILDLLEDATDACEDVANLLENIVVKHG